MTGRVNEMLGFIDLRPNQPKTQESREHFTEYFRNQFNSELPDMVDRVWDLPPIMIKKPPGLYLNLLLEARSLYLLRHFYSCVAMSGIVGERLVKDLFREVTRVEFRGRLSTPPPEAYDQLERVEVSGIVRYLHAVAVLDEQAKTASVKLGEMRNQYAHARGEDPMNDAKKAIGWLHQLVEATVSVFRDYRLEMGAFVAKADQGSGEV